MIKLTQKTSYISTIVVKKVVKKNSKKKIIVINNNNNLSGVTRRSGPPGAMYEIQISILYYPL